MKISSHARKHQCYAIQLATPHPSVLISVRLKSLSRWTRSVVDWRGGAQEKRRPQTGVCAVQRWSGKMIGRENETSASFALQLSACHSVVCGLHQHTHINSPWAGSIETLLDSILSCCRRSEISHSHSHDLTRTSDVTAINRYIDIRIIRVCLNYVLIIIFRFFKLKHWYQVKVRCQYVNIAQTI